MKHLYLGNHSEIDNVHVNYFLTMTNTITFQNKLSKNVLPVSLLRNGADVRLVFLGLPWPTEYFLYINSFIESTLEVLFSSVDLGYFE